MKINQRIFKQRTSPVIPLIPRTPLVDYMNYFLLQTTEKGLTLTYTVSDVTVKILITEGYEGEINSCIHVLFLKSLVDDDVELEIEEKNHRLYVTTNSLHFEVPTSDKEFYFNTNVDGIKKMFKCSSDGFLNAFKHTSPFAHIESISSTYGVKFYVNENIEIGATDGKCMFTGFVEGEVVKSDSFTIPQHYVSLLSKTVDGGVEVFTTKRNAVFLSNGYSITITKNEYCNNIPYFFEWAKKVSIDGYTKIIIPDKKEIIKALKRSELFKEKTSNLIRLEFSKNKIGVSSNSISMGYSSVGFVDCVCDVESKREVCLDLVDVFKVFGSIKNHHIEMYVFMEEEISKTIIVSEDKNRFYLSPFKV